MLGAHQLPLIGLSKGTRDALSQAVAIMPMEDRVPCDIVLKNIRSVAHSSPRQANNIWVHPAEAYAALTPISQKRPTTWHGVWQRDERARSPSRTGEWSPGGKKLEESQRKHIARMQGERTAYSLLRHQHRYRSLSPSSVPEQLSMRQAATPSLPLSPRPTAQSSDPGSPSTSRTLARTKLEQPRLVSPSPYRAYTERSGQRLLWGA